MPYRPQDAEQKEPLKKEEKEGNASSAGKEIQEGAQEVVQEARQEVAAARRPWYQTVRWGRILLAAYAIQLSLFALLAFWVSTHPVLGIDVTITREFQENNSPWLEFLMVAVSYIGNVFALSLGLIVLAFVVFWALDLRLEAITIVVLSVVSSLLNGLIKTIVGRPRPNASLVEILQVAGGKSFPSGHVMSYVAFWGLLFSFSVILFQGRSWWRIALMIISALFVVLVGPSRIYLGDHWASDVLGAYLIGGVLLGITLWIYLKLKERDVLAPRKQRGWYHQSSRSKQRNKSAPIERPSQ